MNANEIKQNITQGEWIAEGNSFYVIGTQEDESIGIAFSTFTSTEEDEANAAAICKAVNGTYVRSINPDKVSELVDMLVEAKRFISETAGRLKGLPESEITVKIIGCSDTQINQIDALLTAAKL